MISAGHAFIQNLRRGYYELGLDADPRHRLPAAFAELALRHLIGAPPRSAVPASRQRNNAHTPTRLAVLVRT